MIGKITLSLAMLVLFTGSVLKISFDSLTIAVGVIVFSGLVGSIGIRRYDKYLLKKGKKLGKKRAQLLMRDNLEEDAWAGVEIK